MQLCYGSVAAIQESNDGLDQKRRELRVFCGKVVAGDIQGQLDGDQVGIDGVDVMSRVAQPASKAGGIEDNLSGACQLSWPQN